MSKYEVIIYWSKDDQAFIAEVPELPGCAADGATYQEALANVETVIREWIETAKDLGAQFLNQKGVWRLRNPPSNVVCLLTNLSLAGGASINKYNAR
jgi:predicted RNase H-like HicB family nuclease